MSAYYNENDPYAAAWLRNLIAAGHIPAGEVDDRSILDVRAADLAPFTECHFFAGIGGWPYALDLAGWHGPVWTGSCPCQPLSSAGQRRGHADERHLWPAFQRLIAECRPATVIGEQVASKDGREWLAGIRADLEHLGYAVGAADLPAAGVSAPHIRQRLFWVADASDTGQRSRWQPRRSVDRDAAQQLWPADRSGAAGGLADAEHAIGRAQHLAGNDVIDRRDAGWQEAHRQPGACRQVRGLADASQPEFATATRFAPRPPGAVGRETRHPWADAVWLPCLDGKARRVEPGIFPLAHGVPNRVGRLRAYGNAIVPQAAAAFVSAFMAT